MKRTVDLLKHSVNARGQIIGRVVVLEGCIDIFLSKYFASSATKTMSLLKLVFSTIRITYGSKVEIFCYIIKKEYPEFKAHGKSLQKDLSDIGELRNRFAHHNIEIDEQAITDFCETKTICLIKYRDEKQPYKISDKQIEELGNKIQYYSKQISELI